MQECKQCGCQWEMLATFGIFDDVSRTVLEESFMSFLGREARQTYEMYTTV